MAIRKTGITALLFLLGSLASAGAQALKLPGDWKSVTAKQSYAALVEALEKSVGENKMGVVNKASASAGIKARFNEDISGNAVIGVFRPDFAKRMLAASIAAGIEAPGRF